MKNIIHRLVASATVVSTFMAVSNNARASITSFTCTTIQDIVWDGRLFIDCIGQPVRFVAFPNSTSPCPTLPATFKTMDDSKMFETMATSAFLSGKPLTITYETGCQSGVGAILTVGISR